MDTVVVRIYRPEYAVHLLRPLMMSRIRAGFPSPAEDHIESRIDLNRELVRNPLGTFYVRVAGDSMSPEIKSGSILIVDRMVETKTGDIVVARVGDEMCIKRLRIDDDGSISLVSENSAYPPIRVTEGIDFEVWGKVLRSIQTH